jgi:hypothetical protein
VQKLQKRWRLGALIVCAMTGCNAILGLRDDYGPADAPDASMDAQVVDTTADVIGDSMMVADAADAGDAGDAAETSTWSPLRLDDLAMWLEASQRIVLDGGNRVAAWRDLSANVNDAVVRLDGGPTHPTYALLNGRPSVRFSSGSLLQVADDNTSLRFGSADFTVLVVGRYTNPPSGNSDALLVGRRCGAFGQGWGLYGNSPPAPDTRLVAYVTSNPTYSIDGGYNDGKVRLLGIRRVADNLELRVNGMVASPLHDVMGLSLGETCPLAIGVQTGGGDQAFLDGDIHEIVIVKGSLPAIDLGTLESYLKTKYAL